MATSSTNSSNAEPYWLKNLKELPETPEKIPAFFFSHGSPILAFSKKDAAKMGPFAAYQGPSGPLARFLEAFGPILLKKYNPKAIVVFSAHWETHGTRLVTDYKPENPLLMDYYGFQPDVYQLKFKSVGDSTLAQRVVDLYKQAGQKARLTNEKETRGEDGRGFEGPGFDHGVFVPFRIMFGEEFTSIPIVQVSIDSSLDPEANWQLGKAVAKLREEGVLVLSGGLTAHNLRDRSSFSPETAKPIHKEFDAAIHEAMNVEDAALRKKALCQLPKHPGFRASQPREDHFVPLYVAAGAGEEGEVRTIMNDYGIPTFAFGL
ncbi:Extradiol aromatic ring-opening dioxygenase [Coprinellus micaceus]|uniref:Extradiol aromatic ring-opening dioxygenase n=1 Tax=Coprinellus micaceus TaxID=71717 RepID=A0A4Y7TP71_COPMI|nr:Extradiol aromatic ring-opening dioxygenase [Coprinellus micaceus]